MTAALLLATALAAAPAPARSAKGKYYRLESLLGLKIADLGTKVCATKSLAKVKSLTSGGHNLEVWRCDQFSSLLDALDASKAYQGWAPPSSMLVLVLQDGRIATAEANKGAPNGGAALTLYDAVVAHLKGMHCKGEDDQEISFAVTRCPKGGPSFEVVNQLVKQVPGVGEQQLILIQAAPDFATVTRLHQALR